ncbi:MAG: PAS domain-containing sensor histidine kinase [Deltaproteobacteria bacterium]|nr:PAS domain-containing sensor histidine kinase [Deltaproteobacteria bacterium]
MVKEGNLSLSPDGVIIRFSRNIEEMLGYAAGDVCGRDFSAIVPDELRSDIKRLLESVKDTGAVVGYRFSLLRKNHGALDLYLSVYPLRSRTGSLYSFLVTAGAEKPSGTPVILSNIFQRMFNFSNDAVCVTDREGGIIDVNQAFLDLYGYERKDVLGKNPRILKSDHSTKDRYKKMWDDILDPSIGFWKGEIINLRKDGTEVPVLLSVNAITDAKGEIRNLLGIASDMSRQKELDKTNKIYFDYIIHDIRGPLTAIIANSELLQMQLDGIIDEKAGKKLKVILACAEKIGSMTENLLYYSRAQGKSLHIKKEKVSFAKVLKDALLPFDISSKALYVNGVAYSGGSPLAGDREIRADHDKLQRAVYNLLSNAFKYAAKEVRVRWELPPIGSIGGGLRFIVSDDGKGLPADEAERIFDAFYQTPEGIKAGGAGLGLSIVKSFVEAHGGKVWVEPGHDRGAAFGFSIPAE